MIPTRCEHGGCAHEVETFCPLCQHFYCHHHDELTPVRRHHCLAGPADEDTD